MSVYSKILAVMGIVLILLAGFGSSSILGAQAQTENWDNRAIFRGGLTTAGQTALDQLPGASIYHIDLTISDDYTTLEGNERVRYTNQENVPLESLYFQLFPNMNAGKETISGLKVNQFALDPVFEDQDSVLRVNLNTPLDPGESVVVEMGFRIQMPPSNPDGFGLLGYRDRTLMLDGFYPAIPVYDEQGWHKGPVPANADPTFQDASYYVVKVTAPAELKLASSGRQVDQAQNGARQLLTFAAGPARDFFMAGSPDFVVVSQTQGETRVNSYTLPSGSTRSAQALQTALNALKVYDQRLGGYPYSEFDVVAAPLQGFLGMEYPGVVMIDSSLYQDNGDVQQLYNLPPNYLLESTIAHETGHQWFYNLVGNDQINQPWLDEALTEYMTGLYYLDQYGQPDLTEYRKSWLDAWDWAGKALIPIGKPAAAYSSDEYNAIVYGRGPLFMEALSQKLGPAGFEQFLHDYTQSLSWGISSEATFKLKAETQCKCDLTPIFKEWVDN